MKKFFTLFLVFMTSIPIALSYDFEIDGLHYNKLGGDSVAVSGKYEYLVSFTIPEKANGYRVTSIEDYAFRECSSLRSITIPNSVTEIGNSAFSGCTSLSSITIPNSVTSIGRSAFNECSSLDSITIPNSVTSIESNTFYKCSSLSSITIPNSVTSIGSNAFYHCFSLSSITIPNSVTSIGEYAFYRCSSLPSITIPNSVINIANHAFQYCYELSTIYCLAKTPPKIYKDSFDSYLYLKNIYVPESSVNDYKKQWKQWSKFPKPMSRYGEFNIKNKTLSTALVEAKLLLKEDDKNTNVGYIFNGDTIYYDCEDSVEFTITGLRPNGNEVTFFVKEKDGNFKEYLFTKKTITTSEVKITASSNIQSQTTAKISVKCDFTDWTPGDYGIILIHPNGISDTIKFEPNQTDTIVSNLFPNTEYKYLVFYKVKEYDDDILKTTEKTFYTKNINASLSITNRTQTTMSVSASIDLGDAKDYGKNGIHWIIGSSSFNDNYIEIFFDEGVYNLDTTFTDLSTEITCAFRVFYKGEDNGDEYYAYGSTRSSKTLPITLNEPELVDVGQTYIEVSSNNIYGDATLFGEYIEVTTNKNNTSEYKVDINGRNKIIINNLDPFTRYYFRSVLTTKEDGTMRSEWYEAKTKAISLSTGIADGISNSSAFLHGTIECDSLSRTEIGFEWKRSDAPSTVKPQRLLVVDRIDENLLFRLEGLSSDHYYDFRTFCYYNDKSYYGEWVGFLTSDKVVLIAPSVSTLKAESSELGVEMKGFIVAGTEVILQRGFECWRDGTDIVATTVAKGSVINSFIPEPWSYTTYKYRAYAKTPAGTTYGETLEVTTEYIKTKIPEIAIKPSSNSAKVTWKNVEQADYYMLSLYNDPSMTNSRGIYTVDKNGNITQKRSTSSVVTCNLTDLLPDTNYYFAVKAYNSSDQMVAEETGTFETTPMETPIDEVEADEEISEVKVQKILHNGHIYIIYDGQVYNILGEEVNLQFCR